MGAEGFNLRLVQPIDGIKIEFVADGMDEYGSDALARLIEDVAPRVRIAVKAPSTIEEVVIDPSEGMRPSFRIPLEENSQGASGGERRGAVYSVDICSYRDLFRAKAQRLQLSLSWLDAGADVEGSWGFGKVSKLGSRGCLVDLDPAQVSDALQLLELMTDSKDLEPEWLTAAQATSAIAQDCFHADCVITNTYAGPILRDLCATIAGGAPLFSETMIDARQAVFLPMLDPMTGDWGEVGLVRAAAQALSWCGAPTASERLRAALLSAIERGARTPSIQTTNPYARTLETADFFNAVAEQIGEKPRGARYAALEAETAAPTLRVV